MASLVCTVFRKSVCRYLPVSSAARSTRHILRRYAGAATATGTRPLTPPLPSPNKPFCSAQQPGEICRDHFRAFLGFPTVFAFYEKQTSTWQYLVADPITSETVIIDPVLDYDITNMTVSTSTADCLLKFIVDRCLKVLRILETHAHADHLSASQYLKEKLPGEVSLCIGKRITQIQKLFARRYGVDPQLLEGAFDILLDDNEEFKLGHTSCKVIHLPGHTPDHVGYVLGDNVFTGDSIFLPDVGSARADFPGGNAKDLYKRLLSLPQDYKLFVGHDYPPGDRHPLCMATVDEQRHMNKHGKTGTTEQEFIKFRQDRDATLGEPKLLHPSLKVNICGGKVPPPDKSGQTHV
ncbi:hypothetical protein C0989_005911 [Termitomyces sp. Mn162]|nr:hypothetical protein C0989_005911 [Termitomyces sp. Mn162]